MPTTDDDVTTTGATPSTNATGRTALAAVFHGPGRAVELLRAAVPAPRGGEVLVAVRCCAICSSDLHTHAGRRAEPTPTVLGHEAVGDVLAFGPNAPRVDVRGDAVAVGDRVTWTIAACCGACPNCLDGLTQKCDRLVKYGHERVSPDMPFRGGLAEATLLPPGTALVRLPADPPPHFTAELASLANCAVATVSAVLRAGFARRSRPGQTVVVLGAGVLGLTACAMAASVHGASAVVALDASPAAAERARAFGATYACADLAALPAVVAEATGGRGADVVVELAGSAATCQAALAVARTGGTVVYAGATKPTDPVVVEPQAVIRRLLRVEGVHNYVAADLVAAVDFLLGPGRRFPFADLVAAEYPLADVEAAFARGHASPGRRVVVKP